MKPLFVLFVLYGFVPSLPVIPKVRIGVKEPTFTPPEEKASLGSKHGSSQGMTGGFWKTRVYILTFHYIPWKSSRPIEKIVPGSVDYINPYTNNSL